MKRSLSIVLWVTVVALLGLALAAPAAALEDNATTMSFTDVTDNTWCRDAVQYVYDKGLMKGIDAATFALSAVVIAFIRVEERVLRGRADLRNVLKDFSKGLRLVREHRMLLALLFVAALINFSTVPLHTFSVAYVADWLNGDATVLSATQFLVVAGTGIGSVICPKITRIRRNTLIVAFGLLQSAALLLFGLAVLVPDLEARRIIALVACLMFGLSSGVINVVFAAALMRNAPKEYIARLSGISNAVMTSAIPAGSFLCSALAAFVKVPVAIAASAALSFVLFLGIAGINTLKNL